MAGQSKFYFKSEHLVIGSSSWLQFYAKNSRFAFHLIKDTNALPEDNQMMADYEAEKLGITIAFLNDMDVENLLMKDEVNCSLMYYAIKSHNWSIINTLIDKCGVDILCNLTEDNKDAIQVLFSFGNGPFGFSLTQLFLSKLKLDPSKIDNWPSWLDKEQMISSGKRGDY